MTVYLLDTNVVSEMTKRRPDARVSAWLLGTPDCYLSALTVGELLRGIEKLRSKDPGRAEKLDSWVLSLRRDCSGRVDSAPATACLVRRSSVRWRHEHRNRTSA